jgi:hypothetical protein
VIGIPAIISLGIATGFEQILHVINSELTELPTGVKVDKVEMLAVVTDGNVPVANPIILLKIEDALLSVMEGVVSTAGYPANDAGAE